MSLLLLFQSPFAYAIPEIIAGLDSAQSEGTGWNTEVRDAEATTVVRTSDTVVTITLDPVPDYDITAQEAITATIPASALTTSTSEVEASPAFTVDEVEPATGNPWYYYAQQA